MAAINLSPESFYKESVVSTRDLATRVLKSIDEGAEIIDIGAMSTAPYLPVAISEETECERIRKAFASIKEVDPKVPISVDTVRSSVAELALRQGASIINDVSGLKNDERMAKLVKDHGASLIGMAFSPKISKERPVFRVMSALSETLAIASKAGIDRRKIVLDPGFGFFRERGKGVAYSPEKLMPWYQWNCEVLAKLGQIEREFRLPICVGLSRKSFIGKILGLEREEDRLAGSLAATAIAVMNGANVVRTHDVKETLQAIRITEAIMKGKRSQP